MIPTDEAALLPWLSAMKTVGLSSMSRETTSVKGIPSRCSEKSWVLELWGECSEGNPLQLDFEGKPPFIGWSKIRVPPKWVALVNG